MSITDFNAWKSYENYASGQMTDGNNGIVYSCTGGNTLYIGHRNGKIVSVNKSDTRSLIYNMASLYGGSYHHICGMIYAYDLLFAMHTQDSATAKLRAFDISLPNTVAVASDDLGTQDPYSIATDWDQTSNTFDIFVARQNSTALLKRTVTVNTETKVPAFSNILGCRVGVLTNGITYRKYGNDKYIYVTTGGSTVYQVVNFAAIADSSNNSLGIQYSNLSVGHNAWGIVWCENLSRFFISEQNGKVYEYSVTIDSGSGKISALTYVGIALGGNSTGSSSGVTNGNAATSTNFNKSASLSTNYINGRTNVYVATTDAYVIKLYPSGGTGIGGDPHIMPLIGNLYTLDNNVKYVKMFENHNGLDKVIVVCETWFLPNEELLKFYEIRGRKFKSLEDENLNQWKNLHILKL